MIIVSVFYFLLCVFDLRRRDYDTKSICRFLLVEVKAFLFGLVWIGLDWFVVAFLLARSTYNIGVHHYY